MSDRALPYGMICDGPRLTQQEAVLQALACCGAFLIAFVGTVHEAVGAALYPWALGVFGPIGFHLIGGIVVIVGILLMLGTLRVIAFPVGAVASVVAAACALAVLVIEARYHQFHYFALCGALAGASTTLLHRAAEREWSSRVSRRAATNGPPEPSSSDLSEYNAAGHADPE